MGCALHTDYSLESVEMRNMKVQDDKILAGCCGIYCGLCPRFQSTAKSRCPGCKILSLTISCKLYNCCVKQKGLVTCAECEQWPCEKYGRFFEYDSFVSHQVCQPNIKQIRKSGLRKWLAAQKKRRAILEEMLADWNEGRSRNRYCLAAALMPPALVQQAVRQAKQVMAKSNVDSSDVKTRARIMKSAIEEAASKSHIMLQLRKKSK